VSSSSSSNVFFSFLPHPCLCSGRAYLKEWSLTFYGTSVNPDRRKKRTNINSNRSGNNNNNRLMYPIISNKVKVPLRPTPSPSPPTNYVSPSPPNTRRDPNNNPSDLIPKQPIDHQILTSNDLNEGSHHPSSRTEHESGE
jgi:hypothetical protein